MAQETENWQIIPHVGAGPLKFGMYRKDIAAFEHLMGPLEAADEGPDNSIVEYRDLGWPVFTFIADKLINLEFDWRCEYLTFDDKPLFLSDSKEILQILEKKNGGALIGLGYVLFDKLSISTGGFFTRENVTGDEYYWEDRPDDGIKRGISVGVLGAYDQYLEHYTPISFLK